MMFLVFQHHTARIETKVVTDRHTAPSDISSYPIIFVCGRYKLEDLKVLKCSSDLLNNVKIGQGQLGNII